MKAKVKTIDINTLTWFDKVNGNTYFAQEIIINFGLKTKKVYYNNFQYGYSSYEHEAIDFLFKEKVVSTNNAYELSKTIVIRNNLIRDCKKRDLINISK